MRLTIRTLLAYLDDVLSPEDRDALTVKLQESEFAQQLADGLRASVRQTHLGSPPVETDQAVEDANTVAEYLDSTLDADAVADVERHLLESGAHLSEVAACHQILTIALTQAAEVPPKLRERMYGLKNAIGKSLVEPGTTAVASILDAPDAANHSAMGAVASGERVAAQKPSEDSTPPQRSNGHPASEEGFMPGDAIAEDPATHGDFPVRSQVGGKPKPEIPDYLRPSWLQRLLPWAMTLGVAGLLGVIVYKIFINPVSRLSGDVTTTDSEDELMPDPTFGLASNASEANSDADNDADVVDSPSMNASQASGSGVEAGNEVSPSADALDSSEDKPPTNAAMQSTTTTPDTVDPDGAIAAVGTPTDPKPSATSDLAAVENPPVVSNPSNSDPKPLPQQHVGVMKSTDGLLLMKADKGWKHVKPEGSISTNLPLVNLPTFRSKMMLEGGVELTAAGASEFSFRLTEESIPWMTVTRGKFVLSASTPDSSVGITVGNLSGSLNLVGAETVASIQVAWFRPPGRSPEAENANLLVINVGAVIGQVNWAVDNADPISLDPFRRWLLVDGQEPVVEDFEAPAWIVPEPENLASIESTARMGLLSLIEDGKQMEMILQESVGFRRAEVAALGARSLLLLGISDAYFGTDGILNVESQKLHWSDHFTSLQNELNIGGQRAIGLRDTIARMSAADAGNLYRLLWGYSQEQLVAGADFELVEGLSSPSMAIRVLSIENLRQITGDTMYFRPQDNALRRENATKKWETKVRTGNIRWNRTPSPLDPLSR